MIKNYLKIALRNIGRNKVSSFINIAGLAIGIACVIFILFYVQDELRYDRFFKQADRIYQVNVEGNLGGQEFLSGTTPPPAGAALQTTFPEVETYTRMFNASDEVVRSEQNKQVENYFTERNVHGVDSNFLQMFDYKLLQGDAATCLLRPDAVVITEQMAKKYFGNSDAMGRILLFDDDKKPFTVTGVLQNLPSRSTLQFDMLRPMISYPAVKRFSWSWVWTQMITYVKLKDNVPNDAAAVSKLESKFPAMVKQLAANAFRRIGQPLDELEKKGGKYLLHLQPLTSIHLYSAGVGSNLFPNRIFHHHTGLCEFHEPVNSAVCIKGKRSGHKKSVGLVEVAIDQTILYRGLCVHIYFHGDRPVNGVATDEFLQPDLGQNTFFRIVVFQL